MPSGWGTTWAFEVRRRGGRMDGLWRTTMCEGSIDEVSSYGGCMTATIDGGA